MTLATKASEYKEACDKVLLGRAKDRKHGHGLKVVMENGSSLSFLQKLRVNKRK